MSAKLLVVAARCSRTRACNAWQEDVLAICATNMTHSTSSRSASSSSSAAELDEIDGPNSPPPATIIIPPRMAESLSMRAKRLAAQQAAANGKQAASTTAPAAQQQQTQQQQQQQQLPSDSARSIGGIGPGSGTSVSDTTSTLAQLAGPASPITREQLESGRLLRSGEVQVLYRSPDSESIGADRHLKEEQAKLVSTNRKQSPVALTTNSGAYEQLHRPFTIEYPATIANLRLRNTGFSWELKLPYHISLTTAFYGANLPDQCRYRLDQMHGHWGARDEEGSEHIVDNKRHSAELHFVHYNLEKYRSLSKAARHPDGLLVIAVFVDALENQPDHPELEKIASQLRAIPLKDQYVTLRQPMRLENLLPSQRNYWTYAGSLTTAPYYESVTWFVLKQAIKCSKQQLQKFRVLNNSLHVETSQLIVSNFRSTQPLNSRTIYTYDESLSSK